MPIMRVISIYAISAIFLTELSHSWKRVTVKIMTLNDVADKNENKVVIRIFYLFLRNVLAENIQV